MASACRGLTARIAVALLAVVAAIPGRAPTVAAQSLAIELKDVAADRIERQRADAVGALPLPGTPDLANLKSRLDALGVKSGDPLFLRIFKEESELELWIRNGETYALFATYPVCHWSGTLGPKLSSGDKQTPEGFYTVTRRQLHRSARHPEALNLGFPNVLDTAMGRTGSYLLVHGGCSSVGCFAMTNAVMAELFDLAFAAFRVGQAHLPVHVFPFRMTDVNLARRPDSDWLSFWTNLREGYEAFERTRVPPRIGVCGNRYVVHDHAPSEVGVSTGPLAACGDTLAAIRSLAKAKRFATRRSPSRAMQVSLPVRRPQVALSDRDGATPSPTTTTGRSALGGPVPPTACKTETASCRNPTDPPRRISPADDVEAHSLRAAAPGGTSPITTSSVR